MEVEAIAPVATADWKLGQVRQQVEVSVLKRFMDHAQQSAQTFIPTMHPNIQAMEHSVNPDLGNYVDVLA